eukprot:s3468_g3.t1
MPWAMPLGPLTPDDRKRAAERASVDLRPDRVVRQATRTNRDRLLESFDFWLVEHLATTLHELLFGGSLDPELVSEALVAYGKDLFQSGRSYSRYAETINGAAALRPTLRRQLAAAWDLAFNWVVSEPHEHHAALPLSILLALASLALLWGWVREACVLLISWTGLLRIGEVFAALRSDVILPRDAAPGIDTCLIKIHQPKTRGRSAKHQVAKIDFPDIIDFLDAALGDCDPLEKIWPFSPQSMRTRFKQLQTALGLRTSRTGGFVPYELSSLRPGGATFLLQLTEDSEYVRRKGRWLSAKVLEIYIQEAVVATYQSKLSHQCRADITTLAGRFDTIVATAALNLRAKIPSFLWPRMSILQLNVLALVVTSHSKPKRQKRSRKRSIDVAPGG